MQISLFFGKYANIILEIVRTIFQVLIIFPKGEIYFLSLPYYFELLFTFKH